MRATASILLAILLVSGCGKESAPPVQLDVITSAASKQLAGKLGERFVKVGKATYDGERDGYHVEVFYKAAEGEGRYVMPLDGVRDAQRQMKVYRGQFPLDLVGMGDQHGPTYCVVAIDELMNQ